MPTKMASRRTHPRGYSLSRCLQTSVTKIGTVTVTGQKRPGNNASAARENAGVGSAPTLFAVVAHGRWSAGWGDHGRHLSGSSWQLQKRETTLQGSSSDLWTAEKGEEGRERSRRAALLL